MHAVNSCLFSNHEEMMAAFYDWDVKVMHYGNGELTGSVSFGQSGQLVCSSVSLNKAMWGRVYQHEPDTVLIFTIDFLRYGSKCWGNDFNDRTIFICDYNKILDTVITAGAKTYSINWSKSALTELLEDYGCSTPINWDHIIEIECQPQEMKLFRQGVLDSLSEGGVRHEKKLIELIARLLYKKINRKEYCFLANEKIRMVVDKIHAIVENDETFDLLQLSHEFSLPTRTLFHQFRKYTGYSPASYEKRLRLFEINKRLRHHNREEKSVGEIARSFGFHHMGQFGADYKKIFGESPSAALAKTSTKILF